VNFLFKKMEFIEELVRINGGFRHEEDRGMFKAIKAGNYYLSIQASEGHYCNPRETYSIYAYNQMELAILNSHKDFFNVHMSSIIKAFTRYNDLVERRDGGVGRVCVFGYVQLDLINDLYKYLENIK
jgi:hypothetical protein